MWNQNFEIKYKETKKHFNLKKMVSQTQEPWHNHQNNDDLRA